MSSYTRMYTRKNQQHSVLFWISILCAVFIVFIAFASLVFFLINHGERYSSNGQRMAEELSNYSWTYIEVDNTAMISDEYITTEKLYLFASRDLTGGMFTASYDFSQCHIGESNFTEVNTTFNLPSPSQDFQAFFLVAELDNPAAGELYCPNLPDGRIAIGYPNNR